MAVLRVLGPLAFAPLLVLACAGPAKPGGNGERCYRAADCQAGLVCLMAHCTNQVGDAVSRVEGPDPVVEPMPDGGIAAGAGGAGGIAGAAGAAGAGASGAGAAGVGGGGAAGAAGAAGTAGAAGDAGAAGMSDGGAGGTPMTDAGTAADAG